MLEKLINYNFKIAGKLLIDKNNKVNYRVIDQEFKSQNQEQVYAWVSDEKVLYIGMASKGIQKRLSEHRAGEEEVQQVFLKKRKFAKNWKMDIKSIFMVEHVITFFKKLKS